MSVKPISNFEGSVNSLLMLAFYLALKTLQVIRLCEVFILKTLGINALVVAQTLTSGWLLICLFNVAFACYALINRRIFADKAKIKTAAVASKSPARKKIENIRRQQSHSPNPPDVTLTGIGAQNLKHTPLSKLSKQQTAPLSVKNTHDFEPSTRVALLQTPLVKRTTPFGVKSTPMVSTTRNARKPRTAEFEFRDSVPAMRSIAGTPISHPNLWCDAPKGFVAPSSMELTTKFEKAQQALLHRSVLPAFGNSSSNDAENESNRRQFGLKGIGANIGDDASMLNDAFNENKKSKSSHIPFDQLVEALQLQQELPFWIEGTRMWLHDAVFATALGMIDRANTGLQSTNMGFLRTDKAFLDSVTLSKISVQPLYTGPVRAPQTLVELFQSGGGSVVSPSVVRDRFGAELFLNITGQPLFHSAVTRRYIADRIPFLAQSRSLASFNADGGFDSFENLKWSAERFPTDSQLVMHLFCVFMDLTMASFSGISIFQVSRERPFSSKYFIDSNASLAPVAKSTLEGTRRSDANSRPWQSIIESSSSVAAAPDEMRQRKTSFWNTVVPFFKGASATGKEHGSGNVTSDATGSFPSQGDATNLSKNSTKPENVATLKRLSLSKPSVSLKRYKIIPSHHTVLVNSCKDEWMIDSGRDNTFIAIALFGFYVREAEVGLLDHFDIMSQPVNMQAIFSNGELHFDSKLSRASKATPSGKHYPYNSQSRISNYGHVSSSELLKQSLL